MPRKYNYRYTNPFNSDDMDREKDSIHSVPFWVGLLVILTLSGVFGIVYVIDGILPYPFTLIDETDSPDTFIAERAAEDLKFLTDLGPKITGSYENEYAVIEFFTIKINTIMAEADSNQYIEFDIQNVTGSYYLNDAVGYMSVYDRVQNVVVKLHGKNNESNHSILLNSHFDTVPTSPGGSDDGINVVAMLEILRKLSKSGERQLHNIIFLFNGAEETPLQAAHGFIAHHKWAKESKILINLESSGAGGKIVLFQTGPETPWLVKYYSKVSHPYGNVIAEEIFQAGIIPSDTDFRVFRDFGNMVGVDMAFFRDGYRYHTSYDGFSNIPMGSYQHVGDNVLSLVKSFANAPEVSETERSQGKSVYFDVLGWFMISYSNSNSNIINSVAIVLSFGIFIFSLFSFRAGMAASMFKYLFITLGAILLCWILSGIFVVGLAFILDLLNKTMSWYGNPWLIFGLYMVPVIGLSGCLLFLTNQKVRYICFITWCTTLLLLAKTLPQFWNLSLGIRSQIQAHVLRILWTIVLVFGVILKIRSAYIVMIPIIFNVLGYVVIHLFRLQHTIRTWQLIYVIFQLVPSIIIMYHLNLIILCFVPLTGRMGASSNPEITVGAITFLFTILLVSPFTVLTNLLRKAVWYYLALTAIFIAFFAILYTPIGFPYSGDSDAPKPQRYWVMHTHREFYNETGIINADSGIFMVNMDRNSPKILKPYVTELSKAASIENDCQRYTLCAMPLTHAKVAKRMPYSTWIPISDPVFPGNETLKFNVISKERLSSTQIKYSVKVSGPDKLIFYLTPKANTKFISTSLIDRVEPTVLTFQGRPVYVILYQLGKGDGTPLTFDFTMEVSDLHSGPALDFALAGRYVHESRMQKTASYLEFLRQFPDWTNVTPWLASYQTHVI